MKKALRLFTAVVLLVLLAAAIGTLTPWPLTTSAPSVAGGETRRILVLSNSIHTDIAIPLAEDTRRSFAFLEGFGIPVSDVAAQWLVVGWGGRAFYLETPTWADLKPKPLFRALTIDRSVLHFDLAGPIDERDPAVRALDVDPQAFARLLDFVDASFVHKGGNVVVIPEKTYGPNDRFFEAHGAFNALFGCNTWTAQGLRAAGLRTGLWNPLPQTLNLSLDLFN